MVELRIEINNIKIYFLSHRKHFVMGFILMFQRLKNWKKQLNQKHPESGNLVSSLQRWERARRNKNWAHRDYQAYWRNVFPTTLCECVNTRCSIYTLSQSSGGSCKLSINVQAWIIHCLLLCKQSGRITLFQWPCGYWRTAGDDLAMLKARKSVQKH